MMDEQKFQSLTVPKLKNYLHLRGITTTDSHHKTTLVRLCVLAHQEALPILKTDDDSKSEKVRRRTCEGNLLPDVNDRQLTWSDDLKSLPEFGFPNVIIYLMRMGWTTAHIENYKESNGYQLFEKKHIQKVSLHKCTASDIVLLRGQCIRQQAQSMTYQVWSALREDGSFLSAGCECIGDDGGCKHVSAMLFSLLSWSDRHKDRHTEACTDAKCSWDQARRESQPVHLVDVDVRHTNTQRVTAKPTLDHYKPYSGEPMLSDDQVESRLTALCKASCSSAVFMHHAEGGRHVPAAPPTITELANSYQPTFYPNFFTYISTAVSSAMCQEICSRTVGQASNPMWELYRIGRITASTAHEVKHHRNGTSLVDKIMGSQSFTGTEHTQHGVRCEPIAAAQYVDYMNTVHTNFAFEKTGLIVHPDMPYLGASPDGLITCSCHGPGLVEIKCPSKLKNQSVDQICSLGTYHIQHDENLQMELKTTSPWYSQVQFQMGVTGRKYCDFVVYTLKHPFIAVQRIYFDEDMWREELPLYAEFFSLHVVPRLL